MDAEHWQVAEETLDPTDWQALRALGHQMLDDMLSYLQAVRERPVWQPIPEEVKARFRRPLPVEPEAPEDVYRQFVEDVLPYPLGNIHPRFWGWAMGNGTPLAMLAEMLAAAMNPNLGGGEQMPTYVELQVIDWCKEMLGYPPEASGLLVSGGSVANLTGLAVARNARAGFDVRRQGMRATQRSLTLYASCEAHDSVQKAIELLGLGSDAMRLVPVGDDYKMEVQALQAAIAADRAAGLQPFCVVGTAGTTNTGSVDDLNALADVAQREDLWLHVDGAIGAVAALSPALRPLVAGMERADSLAFDLHKWMHVPFEAGCVLVRDAEAQRNAFELVPAYMAPTTRGVAGTSHWFTDFGIQASRGFRALKIWMSIKEHGIAKYGRLLEQNVAQAHYLGAQVDAQPELERLAPVSLNIVCFRYQAAGLGDEQLNGLNQELLLRLQERGTAVPSGTFLDGRYALRIAIFNHRSERPDFELLLQEVLSLGRELAREFTRVHESVERCYNT